MNQQDRENKLLSAMRNDKPRRVAAAVCGLFAFTCGAFVFFKIHSWVSVDSQLPTGVTRSECFMMACGVVSGLVQLAMGTLLIIFAIVGAPRQRLLAKLHDRVTQLEEGESEPEN